MKKFAVVIFMMAFCSTGFADLSQKVTMDFRDTDIREIFKLISEKAGMGIVIEKSVCGNMTLTIKNSTAKEALDMVSEASRFSWEKRGDTVLVTSKPLFIRKIRMIQLKHINFAEAAKILHHSVTGDLKVSPCEHLNGLVLNGTADAMAEAMLIIGYIDKKPVK
ncbi:MAG: hypothetical protein CVV42_19395 [Candidatus Riflebacteria bacterium HGW-Riflebacteria-2]|jgi:type II secretory pathway component GspD/PulD (secretin)|nr:MAG: hypothetical protein CVV42_19395 [Candidatus Riflebacteria bacterium HGW-Riflebacteria-2]